MSHADCGVDPAYVTQSGAGRKVLTRGIIVVAVVVALNVSAALLVGWLDPQVDGPLGSSYVTTEQGVGAWRDVLTDLGRPVEQLRVPFDEVNVSADSTVIIVDPDLDVFDRTYAAALARHADAGGRVVLVAVSNGARLFDLDFDLTRSGAARLAVVGDSPLTSGVAVVLTEEGERHTRHRGEVVVGDGDGAVVSRWERGAGELIVVSDPWLFTNEWIGMDDNGVLAVRLAGAGPVVFDEYVHGFGIDQGLGGLGAALRRLGLVGLVAALVAMWAIGKRVGPAEQTERALPPPRAAYLDALAMTIAKTSDGAAYARLQGRAIRHVKRIGDRYVGLSEPAQQEKAAVQLGLDAADLVTLSKGAHSGADVKELAAVAAKIERTTERTHRWTS